MKKRTLLASGLVVVLLAGGVLTYAAKGYQPLLFAVGHEIVRKNDWQPLLPDLFPGGAQYTLSDEEKMLTQRSLEELTLVKGSEMNIQPDEASINKLIEDQIGKTPEERQKKLQAMNTTEEKVRNNYRRATIAFQVKAAVTKDVGLTAQEVKDYYEQNKDAFFAPEFRSIYFLQTSTNDKLINSMMQSVTPKEFPDLTKKYNTGADGRLGGWHELIGEEHLVTHTTQHAADVAFQAPQGQMIGPVTDGGKNFWFLVSEIKPPHQFTLSEVQSKVETALLTDKQLTVYHKWMDEQKQKEGYYIDTDNLSRTNFDAFWHDLPENLRLLFR